jgi:hypothetical protein
MAFPLVGKAVGEANQTKKNQEEQLAQSWREANKTK